MTSIGLITSHGPNGQNVMAAEWTMQVSHDPMLMAVFIHNGSSTLHNIKTTREFGVNIASQNQSTLVSIAGGYSRKEIDKLSLQGLFEKNTTEKTGLPLISGCVVNAICKLTKIEKVGDHNMVLGRVISIKYDESKKPLAYHRNRYFHLGAVIEPSRKRIRTSRELFNMFNQNDSKRFISKCCGVIVRSGGRVLVVENRQKTPFLTIPYIYPRKGADSKKEMEAFLKRQKLKITLSDKAPWIKRLILEHGIERQRFNFILFEGVVENPNSHLWKPVKSDAFLKSLVR